MVGAGALQVGSVSVDEDAGTATFTIRTRGTPKVKYGKFWIPTKPGPVQIEWVEECHECGKVINDDEIVWVQTPERRARPPHEADRESDGDPACSTTCADLVKLSQHAQSDKLIKARNKRRRMTEQRFTVPIGEGPEPTE